MNDPIFVLLEKNFNGDSAYIGIDSEWTLDFNEARKFSNICQINSLIQSRLGMVDKMWELPVTYKIEVLGKGKGGVVSHHVMTIKVNPQHKKAYKALMGLINE